MTEISPEMQEQIEQKMSELEEQDFLRAGMGYDDFANEYSKLLAQVEEDQTALVAAGFDYEKMEEYAALLTLLTLAHGERVASEADTEEFQDEFKQEMPLAKENRALLLAAAKFVVAKTKTAESRRVYKMVRKGNSDTDALNDVVTLSNFLQRYPELMQQVRPGGTAIDEPLLDSAKKRALSLIDLKGKVSTASDNTDSQIDQQNRLITLIVLAKQDIKLYADMAYYNNVDYYNRHYASETIRQYNKKSTDESETVQTQEQ